MDIRLVSSGGNSLNKTPQTNSNVSASPITDKTAQEIRDLKSHLDDARKVNPNPYRKEAQSYADKTLELVNRNAPRKDVETVIKKQEEAWEKSRKFQENTPSVSNKAEKEQLSKVRSGFRLDPDSPDLDHRWPSNTKVYAPALQEEDFRIVNVPEFLPRINQALNQGTKNLDEAYEVIERDGFSHDTQSAVSTPRKSNGWNPSENRPRKIMAIVGQDFPGEADTMKQVQKLAAKYKISPKEIDVVDFKKGGTDKQSIEDAMKRMQRFANKHQDMNNKSTAEAMVVVLAHGAGNEGIEEGRLSADDRLRQGANNGKLELKFEHPPANPKYDGLEIATPPKSTMTLDEKEFKKMANDYLKDFKNTTILFHSCGSGSFIS